MSIATTQATAVSTTRDAGWIRGARFDLNFIFAVAVLAIGSGAVAMFEPSLFKVVLVLDLWLLGYHHVVSTFTRLVFDAESFRRHRFLVIQLPVLVVAGTIAAVAVFGYWILFTVYLYWQWFHYTRQSYGIERIYRRKAPKEAYVDDYVATRALYLVPLFGIFWRSFQAQPEFLGMKVWYIPAPAVVVATLGVLAAVALVYWLAQQAVAAFQGRLALGHSLYLLSHHLIFLTGYVLIEDITTGWLVLNVWHNAQYILLVWSVNNRRFKDGVDPKARFLSFISQSRRWLIYFAVCMSITTVTYVSLQYLGDRVAAATAIPLTMMLFMMINFHHYVVDSVIWKVRKKGLQKQLEIKPK